MGTDGTIRFTVGRDGHNDVAVGQTRPITDYRKAGPEVFGNLPRSGVLMVECTMQAADESRKPDIYFGGVQGEARFEKIGAHGSIDVDCVNAAKFRVSVGDRFGRKYRGVIGLVPPGRHRLTFSGEPDSPYGRWSTTVDVKEGRPTKVMGRLPWKKDSNWSSWDPAILIGRDYPQRGFSLTHVYWPPAIQADDEAIRVIWSHEGELWWSVSTDGKTFTLPRKLDLPVSSGWMEDHPRCFRDESGRFILTFISDRNAWHERRVYMCWSRDFVTWSAPRMISDYWVTDYDIFQDANGDFLFWFASGSWLTDFTSADGINWIPGSRKDYKFRYRFIRVAQSPEGHYDVFTARASHGAAGNENVGVVQFWNLRGPAMKKLKYTGYIDQTIKPEDFHTLSVMNVDGRFRLVGYGRKLTLFDEQPDGSWKISSIPATFLGDDINVIHHPRWGYLVSSYLSAHPYILTPASGPYLLRGDDLEALFK
ncbi:MAG: hypothetical protein CMJ18_05405 [Phycisphaeraceae bacterium]|nr:hypothetical protein [Phycisphaeraceae bacterium]